VTTVECHRQDRSASLSGRRKVGTGVLAFDAYGQHDGIYHTRNSMTDTLGSLFATIMENGRRAVNVLIARG